MGFTPGNQKLGKIANYGVPAEETCFGRSGLCSEACYAGKGFYAMPTVQASLAKNRKLTHSPKFTEYVLDYIRRNGVDVLRPYSSGDIESPAVARKWLAAMRLARSTVFFGYTRSWRTRSGRRSATAAVLRQMSQLPNVYLWLSCDRETGEPPRWSTVCRAYMAVDDDDHPEFPVDLIFRVSRDTVMTRDPVTGTMVCPHEFGLPNSNKVQCRACRLCFDKRRPIWKKKSCQKIVQLPVLCT